MTNELIRFFKSFSGNVVDSLIPQQCLMCDCLVDQQGGCCPDCWARLHFIEAPICAVSGVPFSHDLAEADNQRLISPHIFADPPVYDKARAAVVYDRNSRGLVTGLKFGDRLDLAPWMAQWMERAGYELLLPDTMLIPVPLHRVRRISRRSNQSAELARAIGKATGLEMRSDIIVRRKNTRQQIGLSSHQRQRNVSGAFFVPPDRKPVINGKKVVLIDDVLTSGATVGSLARVLKRAGVLSVSVLTFARVVQGEETGIEEVDLFD